MKKCIPPVLVAFVVIVGIYYLYFSLRKENFTAIQGKTYLNYLKNQKTPGYFDKKLSTVSSTAIRVAFPLGSGGHDPVQVKRGGISAVAVYPENLDKTISTLSANIFFAPNFPFDQGKLGMGFEMGTATATGGNGSPTASSCRIIFRNKGAASCYIYVPLGSKQTDPQLQAFADGKSKYGKEVFLANFPEGTFKTGVIHKVAIGVKMNTPGKADGECFMKIDKISVRKTGIMWLTSNVASGITRVNNTALIGGGWTSSRDTWYRMSNMKLTPTFPRRIPLGI